MRGVISALAFAAALAFFGFLIGVLSTRMSVPPYTFVERPLDGLFALYIQIKDIYLDHPAWQPDRGREGGLLRHEPALSEGGLTLHTSAHLHGAVLLDEKGAELYRWSREHAEIWQEGDTVPQGFAGKRSFVWKARIMPDGGIVALYALVGVTPYGGGIARLDIDGNVVWHLFDHVHHDFNLMEDGRIVALVQEWNDSPAPLVKRGGDLVLEDFIVILDQNGQVERRISLVDAALGTGFEWIYDGDTPDMTWDISHANSVLPLTAVQAANLKGVEAGDFMLSLRELEAAVVVSATTGKVVWARRGPFYGQHDAELTDDGQILVYDNRGAGARGLGARVIEIDPETMQVAWQFPKPESDERMYSLLASWQQRLKGGNTLIVESMAGRLLEVTPAGQVVWEYVNPVREQSGLDEMPIIPYAERLDLDELPDALRARLSAGNAADTAQDAQSSLVGD